MIKLFIIFLFLLISPFDGWAYTTPSCSTISVLSGMTITGTCYQTDGSLTDTQNAVAAAAVSSGGGLSSDGKTFTGDVVYIPAGSFTWTGFVNFSSKNVLITGAGINNTTITNDSNKSFYAAHDSDTSGSPGVTSQWRLCHMTLTTTSRSGYAIEIYDGWGSAPHYGWRIDHIKFYYPSRVTDAMFISGMTWGLIDNCNITIGNTFLVMDAIAGGETGSIGSLYGSAHMALAYQPGTANAIYIEDCTFTGSSTMPVFDTNYAGGRVVLRYNTLTDAAWYAHWTSGGSVNAMWFEIYNNNFGGATGTSARFQGGGTGLIYNNKTSGITDNYVTIGEDRVDRNQGGAVQQCDGTHNWDNNTDAAAPGWPCLSQTGRDGGKTMAQIQAGTKQASFPLYLWNNGPQDKCYNPAAAGDACDNTFGVNVRNATYFKSTAHSTGGFGNGDVDYSITASQPSGAGTHTLTYTAYTYPHPLQGGVDETAPVLSTVTIGTNGTSWTFAYSEAVTCASTANCCDDYAVSMSTQGAVTLSYASGSGSASVVCTGNKTVLQGETVTAGLDYTTVADGIEDAAGNDLASIDDKSVTNNSTQTTAAVTGVRGLTITGGEIK